MSNVPQGLADEIADYLQSISVLGRLYSKSAPRPKELDRFMPSSVSYSYWTDLDERGQTATLVEFQTGGQAQQIQKSFKLSVKELSTTKKDEVLIPFEEDATEENKKIVLFGSVKLTKTAKVVSSSTRSALMVTVVLENTTSYKMKDPAKSTFAEDEYPEKTTSLYGLRIYEQLTDCSFVPDPKMPSKERLFQTENIVNFEINAEKTVAQFRDYGLAHETVERPIQLKETAFESIKAAFDSISENMAGFSDAMAESLRARSISSLSEFQKRAIIALSGALRGYLSGSSPTQTFLLNAPTAGGKTEGFLIPILAYAWLMKNTNFNGTKALIFYPTKALADDQFQRLAFYVSSMNEKRKNTPISIGVFHGDVRSAATHCLHPSCGGELAISSEDGKLKIVCSKCSRIHSPSQVAVPKGKCPWCYEGFCYQCGRKLTIVYECSAHAVVERGVDDRCPQCSQPLTISKVRMRCDAHGLIDMSALGLISEMHPKKENPKTIHDVDFVLKHEQCGREYSFIKYLRNQVLDLLPDIVITNPDIIHKYMTTVPARRDEAFQKHAFYDYQKVFRLLGKSCYYCESCKWAFDTYTGICPLKDCKLKGQKAATLVSKPGFIVVDEIHMIRGNFGCNATGFFSNLTETIAQLCNVRPICVSATATVKNERQPPAAMFGFEQDQVVLITPTASTAQNMYERLHLFILPKGMNTISTLREILVSLYVDRSSLGTSLRMLRLERKNLQTLVFFENKRNLYETAGTLHPSTIGGAQIDVHTGDTSRLARRAIEEEFSRGAIQVLLATSTLEVGVDFDFLTLLINFGVPFSYNSYLQRVGRAGRRGPALIVNILRYQVPLDNYYFEHFRELISYSKENVDIVPIVRDIPLSVRRHVFAFAANLGVLSYTANSARQFYTQFLARDDDFTRFHEHVRRTFVRPPMVRMQEVEDELRNACEFVRGQLETITEDIRLNDALDNIARHDSTYRLDFSLRNNEVDVPIFIRTAKQFTGSLRGSRSSTEDDVDILESELDKTEERTE